MEKLKTLLEKNPKLQSDKPLRLQLAIRDGKVVKGTGPHEVILTGCENAKNKSYKTQQIVKGVNLVFAENGIIKKYFVPTLGDNGKFHYLIEKFADIQEGTNLILEYKRKEGDFKGFIDVIIAGEESPKTELPKEEAIALVEDDIDVGELPL